MSPGATTEAAPASPAPQASTGPIPLPGATGEVMMRADGLSKRFKIYTRPADRLVEWLTGNRVKRHTDFWAVRAVSFGVRRGECLGIIGANGSGKSTLLKMVTGALLPTEGSAEVRGRALSLLDLGTGLNPLLTGRASIHNAARMLGFPAGYARATMPEIEAFADLGEFFDRPAGLYSAGMRVRLSFSMFACFRPEVFVVDEALAVGDVFFQQKCHARLRRMLDDGLTMLFVSHDQGAVLNLCDRAILMEKGRAAFEGEPAEALARYTASLRTVPPPPSRRPAGTDAPPATGPGGGAATDADLILSHDVIGARTGSRFGSGAVRVLACRVTGADGRDGTRAFMGEPLTFHVLIEGAGRVAHPRVGIQFVDRFSNLLFACGTRMLGHVLPPLGPGDRLVVRLDITMDLAPGEYSFGVGTSEPADDDPESGVVHDQVTDLGPIRVALDRSRPRPFHGAARLPVRISHAAAPRVPDEASRAET